VSIRTDVPGDSTTNYDAKDEYLALKGLALALKEGIENEDEALKEL